MDITTKNATSELKKSARQLVLGIPGYTFLDLHEPERLADLHATFLAFVERRDGRRCRRHGARTRMAARR